MASNDVDLSALFGAVTQSLAQNQHALNQADAVNQDHGSNMVQTFQTITSALEQKQGSSASTALAYAAKQVSKTSNSGSAQQYAQNLTRASAELKGKNVDAQGALQLLQMLIGGGQSAQTSAAPGGDLLGSILGSMGGAQPASDTGSGSDPLGSLLGGMSGAGGTEQTQGSGSGDLLGSILGSLGGSGGTGQSGGLNLGSLLQVGAALLGGQQGGQGGGLEALASAFLSGSGMGNTTHREQSTQIVVNAFLQALGMAGR